MDRSCKLCAKDETTFLNNLSSCSVQWPQRDCSPVTARWHRWNIWNGQKVKWQPGILCYLYAYIYAHIYSISIVNALNWKRNICKLLAYKYILNQFTCVISCVVISIACSSSLLSSSVGRFICLSWSKASSFIFCRTRVISYWIWKQKSQKWQDQVTDFGLEDSTKNVY